MNEDKHVNIDTAQAKAGQYWNKLALLTCETAL